MHHPHSKEWPHRASHRTLLRVTICRIWLRMVSLIGFGGPCTMEILGVTSMQVLFPLNYLFMLPFISFVITLAKPKSVILAFPLCNNILAGLMSRWMIFYSYRTLNPSTMCFMKITDSICYSMIYREGTSLILFSSCLAINYYRSPSSQYSKNMYRLLSDLETALNSTIF